MKLLTKHQFLEKSFGKKKFRLLDVGAGNHSASKTVKRFPNCRYYGIDMVRDYNNTDNDIKAMIEFYNLNLDDLNFDMIPNDWFDGLWMVHVIEHLKYGEEVLIRLLPKLKKGGYIYIETPLRSSLNMKGSLSFWDDPSHTRIYERDDTCYLLKTNGCIVVKTGVRRNIFFILAMPFRIIWFAIRKKRLIANIFMDIAGYAGYVYGKKVKN